jgi:hypothetical protein
MIFSFGARRSGTFWLQRIITSHPRVAAVPSESFFFASAIAPLFESFQDLDRYIQRTGRIYAHHEVLLDATRDFCDRIFLQFSERGTDRIAERTPAHIEHIDLMNAIYPDAYYLHIVRDGRDAARSLASRDWYSGSLQEAALEWRRSVLAARAAQRPERFLEVRYEELLANPVPLITQIFDFLDLDVDTQVLHAAGQEARVQLNADSETPVSAQKWRWAMAPEEQDLVLRLAGEALLEYGYVTQSELAERSAGAAPGAGSVPKSTG